MYNRIELNPYTVKMITTRLGASLDYPPCYCNARRKHRLSGRPEFAAFPASPGWPEVAIYRSITDLHSGLEQEMAKFAENGHPENVLEGMAAVSRHSPEISE
jgi:hypothetical protein